MNAGLTAELSYADAVALRPEHILAGIRRYWPSAELADGTGHGGAFMVAFPELTGRTADDLDVRLLVAIRQAAPQRGSRDLSQTWEWPDAEQALAAVSHTVTAAEVFGTSFAPANRVRAFNSVVRGIAAATTPAGIWWPGSAVATHPGSFGGRPLAGIVNVRMFNVAGSLGTLLMDTLGLAALGLPDLECVFAGLPPDQMAGYLQDAAEYLVAGNVIRGGDTMQGLTGNRRWKVAARPARTDPDRAVLSITPR
ncbi:DUF4261 domain-containing protein [Dactylosporangium sp. NPDC005555]|uniref:DUF4261 domain-containing protein n=1 Tax=Dactylosporangium sp. NPDC005555 TaxID=3154889 RepID=UPI0033B2FB96